MIYLFCFIIGLFLGISIMCLLQINRELDNKENNKNNMYRKMLNIANKNIRIDIEEKQKQQYLNEIKNNGK